jgi:hypothetical protein
MTDVRLVTALGLAAALVAVPALADAQNRSRPSSGRAVRRAGPPPRQVTVRTYRPAYYRPYYYSPYYYGPFASYPGVYGPYRYGYAFGYPSYGYPGYVYGGYGYGYGYGRRYAPYGGVRIDIRERDAEVYVDGYFAGIVDDFDGAFQQLSLEPGPHRIEIRAQGFPPVTFDVHIEPGRTITYRSQLGPRP